MLRQNDSDKPAFTLVELILVMALLATIMAVAAPSLARSFRQRALDQEATRLLALTEYARDEAMSQGLPMVIWINAETGRYGMEVKTGYVSDANRHKEFTLNPDVHFDGLKDSSNAIEFAPDGAPDVSSVASVRLVDRFDSAVTVQKTTDGMGYEIVKEAGK